MIDTSPFPIKTFYLSLRRFPWKHLNMPHLLFLLWMFPWPRTFLAKLSGESVTPGWEACLHVAKGFSSGWAEVGHLCHLGSLKSLMRFALHLHHTSIHTLWSLKQETAKLWEHLGRKGSGNEAFSLLVLNRQMENQVVIHHQVPITCKRIFCPGLLVANLMIYAVGAINSPS